MVRFSLNLDPAGGRIDVGRTRHGVGGGVASAAISLGAGQDVLTGGAGNDTIRGGSGNDTFVFAAGDGNDIIVDFDSGEDDEVVDMLKFVGFNLGEVEAAASEPNAGLLLFDFGTEGSVLLRGDLDDISYI